MSQAFDYLNTGNTGQTFGNEEVPQVVDEAIEEQRLELAQLLPSVQAILDTIDAEINAICDIRAYVKTLGARPTAADIKAEYAARELFIGMADRLKTNIANKVSDVERSL
jgi:hypothetical protein